MMCYYLNVHFQGQKVKYFSESFLQLEFANTSYLISSWNKNTINWLLWLKKKQYKQITITFKLYLKYQSRFWSFMTAVITVNYMSLSWAKYMQSTSYHSYFYRSSLILSSCLQRALSHGLFHSCFLTKILYKPF